MTAESNADGLWVSLTDVAKQRNVSPQAIAKRVARLEQEGVIQTRSGPGRTKLVNLAQFDRAVGETEDAVRHLNGTLNSDDGPAPVPATENHVLAREQARRAAYAADLAKLDLDERLGKLLPIEEVRKAMVRCAEAVVRVVDRFPTHADGLAAAVAKDGVQGARAALKKMARDLRETLSREMRLEAADPVRDSV